MKLELLLKERGIYKSECCQNELYKMTIHNLESKKVTSLTVP
jgi:hypothetical protein